jgi:predicted enzyme related to lactoylglutathione lyase
VFGWTFDDYTGYAGSPYWGIVTGPAEEPGIDGGLLPRAAPRPEAGRGANSFVCTVVIVDYDETERRILAAGGELVQPKRALPGMAWQGYYLDTEGNTFGIHQPDSEAA